MSWLIAELQDAHLWEAIGLAFFVIVLVMLKVPGMAMAALDARGAKIQAQLDEATKLREEAQGLLAEIKTRREETERQAAEMLALAKSDAQRLAVEAKAKLEGEIKRRGALAERRIALAEAQAAAEVKAAAAELAAQAAEKVLAARLATATTDPLVDQAVAQIATKLQ
jgi:F-type H+-transporting ATPase subunit b